MYDCDRARKIAHDTDVASAFVLGFKFGANYILDYPGKVITKEDIERVLSGFDVDEIMKVIEKAKLDDYEKE